MQVIKMKITNLKLHKKLVNLEKIDIVITAPPYSVNFKSVVEKII